MSRASGTGGAGAAQRRACVVAEQAADLHTPNVNQLAERRDASRGGPCLVERYGPCGGVAGAQTKALWPVIDFPTIRMFISRVPSKE